MADVKALDISVFRAPQSAQDNVTSLVFTKVHNLSAEGLAQPSYVQSEIVDTDGQAAQFIYDDRELSSTVETEYKDGTPARFNRAIHAVESITNVTGTDIATTATGYDSGASNAFADLTVGDFFWPTGHHDTGLNIAHHITAKADDNNVTVAVAPTSVEAAGGSITIYSRKNTSGKTRGYEAFQTRKLNTSLGDNTSHQTLLNGAINTFGITMDTGGIIKVSEASLYEKKVDGVAALAGQTDGVADSSASYSSRINVKGYFVDGVSELCRFKTMDIQIDNGYESDSASGCDSKVLAKGPITSTMTITSRMAADDSDKWENRNSDTSYTASFAVLIASNDGATEVIYAQDNSKITESKPVINGKFAEVSLVASGQRSVNQNTTITSYRNN
tara:strand:+ start:104 stop:1270 length:1167 start_codon:yes stop_codon:yes gene_type:complete